MIVKGVFGKSVGSNFGVRATSPGAVGILSEIPALDLRGERRFRFGHSCLLICLLSVRRADVVGATKQSTTPKSTSRKSLIDIDSPPVRPPPAVKHKEASALLLT